MFQVDGKKMSSKNEANEQFTITWRLQNFKLCIQKPQQELASPAFVVDGLSGTKWCLLLYPRGIHPGKENDISLYLSREVSDYGSDEVVVIDYDLSLLGVGGKSERTVTIKNRPFYEKSCVGLESMATRPELLQVFPEKFLLGEEGVLTVRCRMRLPKLEESEPCLPDGPVGGECVATTRLVVEEGTSDWTLRDFSSLRTGEERSLVLLPVLPRMPGLRLGLHLGGGRPGDRDLRVRVERLGPPCALVYARMRCSVLSGHGVELAAEEDEFWFEEGRNQAWKCPVLTTRNMLVAKRNLYLAGDALRLRFHFVLSLGEEPGGEVEYVCSRLETTSCRVDESERPGQLQETLAGEPLLGGKGYPQCSRCEQDIPSGSQETSAFPCPGSDLVPSAPPRSPWPGRDPRWRLPVARDHGEPTRSFRADVLRLLGEGLLSDFTLRAGARLFPVHKAVLSVRSPVFEAMFGSGMEEASGEFLDIPDLDADTLHALLVYAYSDIVEGLDWGLAMNLFVASDKYEMLQLKGICKQFLVSDLRPENVLEVLQLGSEHCDEQLKSAAVEFVATNDREVIGSEEWGRLERENPQLAYETLKSCYTRKMTSGRN